MSAPLARREQVAREVSAALDESRLRLAESELDRMLRAADGRGARLFEEEVILRERPGSESLRVRGLKALGISTLSVHRVLGLGGWQAQVLGGEAAERAGALFNLGIVLFDAALDRGTPTSRRQVLRFDMARLDRTGVTPEIAFLGIVAQRFFEVAGERVARGSLERLLAAELASAGAAPSLRAMRRKSVEPFVLMAALGGRDPAMARVFGRAVWIVDDLWDWDEDAATRTGRPWFRRGPDSAILAEEVRCLRAALSCTSGWPEQARHCLAATLGAWIRMPRPQPLFAATIAPASD
jgi:hypothetical protein